MTHELKCWPEYFRKIWDNTKTFELRKNDRNFQEGDTLLLREFNPVSEGYSGREIKCQVPYLLGDRWGIDDGYVCMSITDLERSKTPSNTDAEYLRLQSLEYPIQ